jgi:hypothetical protein
MLFCLGGEYDSRSSQHVGIALQVQARLCEYAIAQ